MRERHWTEHALLDLVEGVLARDAPVHVVRQVAIDDRRIDAIAVLEDRTRIGIEAKTSAADYRRECDEKRRPTEAACHLTVYLAPAGMIPADSLPPGWGLWEAYDDGVRVALPPVRRPVAPTALDAFASGSLRRLHHAERPASDSPEGLRAEVERLSASLATARQAVERERGRVLDAAEQVAALTGGPMACRDCGEPVAYGRLGRWVHLDRKEERACRAARAEVERLRLEREVGARYVRAEAPRVLPAGLPVVD